MKALLIKKRLISYPSHTFTHISRREKYDLEIWMFTSIITLFLTYPYVPGKDRIYSNQALYFVNTSLILYFRLHLKIILLRLGGMFSTTEISTVAIRSHVYPEWFAFHVIVSSQKNKAWMDVSELVYSLKL